MQQRHRQVGGEPDGDDLRDGRHGHVDLDVAVVGQQHGAEEQRQPADDQRLAYHQRHRHRQRDGAHIQAADLGITVAEHLHVADRACRPVDHRFRKQVHEHQEDEHGKPHQHADHVVHHADELLADGVHALGRQVAGKVARVQFKRMIGSVAVEIPGIVFEESVEVVKAHVHGHVGLRAPGVRAALVGDLARFVLVFVVQADGLPVGETELVDQPVAEHHMPVAHGKVVPIARILGHAVYGDRLRAWPLAAIVFQRIHGILFGLRIVDFQRRFQRVHVLGDHVVVQVLGVVRHGRQNGQREQQQHAGKPDSHEQRGEISQVAQEHPHAEARDEAQALGQGKTALHAAFAGFVAQKLQRGVTHLPQKPQQRDAYERRHGQRGGLREHAPAPGGVVRRQAVAAVIQVAHRLAHQGVAGHVAYHGRYDAHRRWQRQVVRHQLAATITAGQQRADDRAFLLDGARCQHHEHERHDDDDHVQKHAPHGGVARNIVGGVTDSLVGARIGQVVHGRPGGGKCAHHVLLGVGALRHGQVTVGETHRVRVRRLVPGGLKRCETAFGNLGHAERQRVHREIGVALEQRLVIGGRHDAAHGEALAEQLHLLADGYAVVRGEHAVDGNLVGCLGHAPLGVCGQVNLGAMLIDAQRAVAAVVSLRVVEIRVE